MKSVTQRVRDQSNTSVANYNSNTGALDIRRKAEIVTKPKPAEQPIRRKTTTTVVEDRINF